MSNLELARAVEQLLLDTYFKSGRLFNRHPSADSAKGMLHSDATRLKLSEVAKHRPPPSDSTREKIRQAILNKDLTEDHRTNLASANKDKWSDPEFRQRWEAKAKRAVSVDGVEYPSLTEAGKDHGVTAGRVRSRILSDNPKFANWKYVNEVSTRRPRKPQD